MDILRIIGRANEILKEDISVHEDELQELVSGSTFLVIGGAGSIGKAVTKEIFKRRPLKLHIVDISENNIVELVRDLRSSFGYISGDFQTFALDVASVEYEAFINADGKYDYVLNLSALKHVRSEKDPFTLMRMIDVNIINTINTLDQSVVNGTRKYFCVSTDKAANPVSMMGASKRIMEMFMMQWSFKIDIVSARFANVAFSDGSLLHGFTQRIQSRQPIVAPFDVRRYFVTPKEAGEICLISCLLGGNREIFFPKLSEDLHMVTFKDIACNYLASLGLEPYVCNDEEEARNFDFKSKGKTAWPCLFTKSDTTGEKDYEEFYTSDEILEMNRFKSLGIVKSWQKKESQHLNQFLETIQMFKQKKTWTKEQLVELFFKMIPEFGHKELRKHLDEKM